MLIPPYGTTPLAKQPMTRATSSSFARIAAPLRHVVIAAALCVAAAARAAAQEPAPDDGPAVGVDTLRVVGRISDLTGIATSASEGRVGAADLRSRPLSRPGELLETVPGMIVTQHSGEGKANQYFIRGFNLDHGTDFQTLVEGMPVNLPTHGHGQGYTDLGFLIPEFVAMVDYRLGVHHPEVGDFGSAGGAQLHLSRTFERPFGSVTLGQYGYRRLLAGASNRVGPGTLLVGGEGQVHDGPWERSNDLRKLNGMARYSVDRSNSRLSVLAMAYRNLWLANDQIPSRAVRGGLLGRFGQIDSSDGGRSHRYSLSGSWDQQGEDLSREVRVYGIRSELDLYSNFTYQLDDPERGDQFNQKDGRFVLGAAAQQSWRPGGSAGAHEVSFGVQTRADLIDRVGLYRTEARERRGTVREDQATVTASGAFVEVESRWARWLRGSVGVRGDVHTFDVESDRDENSGAEAAAIVSPKASLVVTPAAGTEIYLSGGLGFHSNDARGTTISVDPVTGEAAEPVDPLVRSRGGEVGLRTSAVEGLRTTVAVWTLELDSELLFVGDAGATEPAARSHRQGVTFANFYRPHPSLSLDADLSLARARLDGSPEDGNRVPGAMERVLAAGIAWSPGLGAFGAIRLRHFGEYPLTEDNAVRAEPTTLLNAEVGYAFTRGLRLEATMLNLLDSEASDIQYFYASRLEGEPSGGVEDIHFHPVEPRQLRLGLYYAF